MNHMRLTSPSLIVVSSREGKLAKIQDFIVQDLASRCKDPRAAATHTYTLIARAPDSPAAQALQAVLADVTAANISVRVVVLETEPMAEDVIPASLLDLSSADVRLLQDQRFADAHEQLWLGNARVWIGDCMRRDPAKRDAFEVFHTSDAKAAVHAEASFAKLRAAAKPMTRLAPAALAPEVIHAGQSTDASNGHTPVRN